MLGSIESSQMPFRATLLNMEKDPQQINKKVTCARLLRLINSSAFIVFSTLAVGCTIAWVCSISIPPLVLIAAKRIALVWVATTCMRMCCCSTDMIRMRKVDLLAL